MSLPTNYLAPTGREEAWRFTPLKRLGGLHDLATSVTDRISIDLVGPARQGFSVKQVPATELPPFSKSDDAVVQRLRSEVKSVTHLQIDKEALIADPIFFKRNAIGGAEFSRSVITAGPHSKATVIVENSVRFEAQGCRWSTRASRRGRTAACLAWKAAEGFGRSRGDEQPTQNWYGQGRVRIGGRAAGAGQCPSHSQGPTQNGICIQSQEDRPHRLGPQARSSGRQDQRRQRCPAFEVPHRRQERAEGCQGWRQGPGR